MVRAIRKIRALFPNFHVDFDKYIRAKKSEEIKRIQKENDSFIIKQGGGDQFKTPHVHARGSKLSPQTVWHELLPL